MDIDRYTKGEWIAEGNEIYVEDDNGRQQYLIQNWTTDYSVTLEEDLANLERAALCVNFCDGYSNEDLRYLISLNNIVKDTTAKVNQQWLIAIQKVVGN